MFTKKEAPSKDEKAGEIARVLECLFPTLPKRLQVQKGYVLC